MTANVSHHLDLPQNLMTLCRRRESTTLSAPTSGKRLQVTVGTMPGLSATQTKSLTRAEKRALDTMKQIMASDEDSQASRLETTRQHLKTCCQLALDVAADAAAYALDVAVGAAYEAVTLRPNPPVHQDNVAILYAFAEEFFCPLPGTTQNAFTMVAEKKDKADFARFFLGMRIISHLLRTYGMPKAWKKEQIYSENWATHIVPLLSRNPKALLGESWESEKARCVLHAMMEEDLADIVDECLNVLFWRRRDMHQRLWQHPTIQWLVHPMRKERAAAKGKTIEIRPSKKRGNIYMECDMAMRYLFEEVEADVKWEMAANQATMEEGPEPVEFRTELAAFLPPFLTNEVFISDLVSLHLEDCSDEDSDWVVCSDEEWDDASWEFE